MVNKQEEIEAPMKEVAEFYLKQDGVLAVHYIKRTHRQKDFNAVKEGDLPSVLQGLCETYPMSYIGNW